KWQTISFDIDAAPGTEIRGSLYGLPAEIWIRKASWITANKSRHVQVEAGRHAGLLTDHGLTCLQLAVGSDQIAVRIPNEKGPGKLELHILVLFSNLIASAHSQTLLRSLGI
ncbi:MAG: hypothetical protein ABUL49_00490, partial [bacterium]